MSELMFEHALQRLKDAGVQYASDCDLAPLDPNRPALTRMIHTQDLIDALGGTHSMSFSRADSE